MNEARISGACRIITNRRAALKWLQEYGEGLTDDKSATVRVVLHFAGSCPGSEEAAEVLGAYGRFSLPEIRKAATECCRNDIAMAVQSIREELGTLVDEVNP